MSISGQELFDKVSSSISADHPSFEVRYKDESLLMKILAVLAYPFNESFATDYTTTLGSKTYLPSRAEVATDWEGYAGTLAHEGVHVYDNSKHLFWFKFSYSLNQSALLFLMAAYAVLGSWIPVAALAAGITISYLVLSLLKKLSAKAGKIVFFILSGLSMLGYLGLAYWFSGWWTALAVGVFAPLLPLTSYWRAKWEYRGYAMTIAFDLWRFGSYSDDDLKWIQDIFTSSDYYFMDTNATRVMTNLKASVSNIESGAILLGADARPYQRTYDLLKQLDLVKLGVASA